MYILYKFYQKGRYKIMAQKKRSKRTPSKVKTNSKKRKSNNSNEVLVYHIIVSALVSLFFGIFLYTGGEAIVNVFVKNMLKGLFGTSAYIIPLALAANTAYLIYTKNVKLYWMKFTFSFLALVNLAAIIHLITANDLTSVAVSIGNGGWFGAVISITLVKLVQVIASYVILILTLVVLLGSIAGVSAIKSGFMHIKQFVCWIRKIYGNFKDNYIYYEDDEFDEEESTKPVKRTIFHKTKEKSHGVSDTNFDAANSFAADVKSNNSNTDYMDLSDGIDDFFGTKPNNHNTDDTDNKVLKSSLLLNDDEENAEEINDSSEISTEEVKEKEKNMTKEEKAKFINEFDKAIEKEEIEYIYPSLKLLNKPSNISSDHRVELRNTAQKLISVLDSFGVRAKLLQVTQGPAVTRYEIQPDTGIKLSKISSLADDIALNLAVSTVLVAPVPGKAAVGIEIPNNKVSSVNIQEILSSEDFADAKSKLTIALGKDIGGSVVVGDIAKMPHLLIAGATGSGKSVCINTIIMSLLYKASPKDVKLIMVDPKVVELGVYNGIPHLLVPVVTDPKKAAGALNWAVTEMMRRYDLFKETGVRKLESYNKLMQSTGGETVPQLVIIIDELADLMMVAAKEVEDYICRIAQLARAAGIHLIIATQRPSVDVITGLIKANIPSRIAFAVSSQVDSRTILDKGGAEKLLGMGDMLYYPTGSREARRVQGAFVSDGEIEKVLNFIKENSGEENHYSNDLAEQIERCATGENGVTPDTDDDGDSLLPDAINLAIELGKISTSMVQRRLGVGYSRAGRIIDQMEARGIISGANGSKPRDVLISYADSAIARDNSYDDEEE